MKAKSPVKFILLFAAATCSACSPTGQLIGYRSYDHFNTEATWAFVSGSEGAEETWNAIKETLDRIEYSLSTESEGGSVARFNACEAGETVEIDAIAYDVLAQAKSYYEKTSGAYNPAVGLLVDLWGFTPRFTGASGGAAQPYDREDETQRLPDEKYLTAFTALTDFSGVELFERDGKYYAKKPESARAVVCDAEGRETEYTMRLNLGGIGKGYAVDETEKLVRAAGYERGYFNLGGSSMFVLNGEDGGAQEIGILNPRPSERFPTQTYATVREENASLSSSGDYQLYYEIDGKRYCHIVNPFTGYPVNAEPQNDGSGLLTASVFGLSAAEGDAVTTALLVMGRDDALSYIAENLSGARVSLVYYDGAADSYTVYTNYSDDRFSLNVSGMEVVKL